MGCFFVDMCAGALQSGCARPVRATVELDARVVLAVAWPSGARPGPTTHRSSVAAIRDGATRSRMLQGRRHGSARADKKYGEKGALVAGPSSRYDPPWALDVGANPARCCMALLRLGTIKDVAGYSALVQVAPCATVGERRAELGVGAPSRVRPLAFSAALEGMPGARVASWLKPLLAHATPQEHHSAQGP